jgi:hypothetical protein
MRWTVAALLRPVTFVLAIVAAVLAGNGTDSFWLGLLAFLIAIGAGRALGALVRGRGDRAVYRAIWPAAATASRSSSPASDCRRGRTSSPRPSRRR